jgi:RNA polymerase sigma-70 factor (ECF subfamily)
MTAIKRRGDVEPSYQALARRSSAEIVERLQSNDPAMWQLVATRVYEFTWLRMRSRREDADDVAQNALAAIHSGLHHFDVGAPAHFISWLHVITFRTIVDFIRRQDIGPFGAQRSDEDVDQLEALTLSVEDRLDTTSALSRLKDVLREEEYALLIKSIFEERTAAEMADDLGVPHGTVRTRLHRALFKARRAIVKEDGGMKRPTEESALRNVAPGGSK